MGRKQFHFVWSEVNAFFSYSLPSASEAKTLRKHLTFSKRHSECSLYLIMHSISANNVASMVHHFDFAIFTSGGGNEFNFVSFVRAVARDLYPDLELAKKAWRDFCQSGIRFLHYDAKLRLVTWRNLDMTIGEQSSNNKEFLNAHVAKFLVSQDLPLANLLFEYLRDKIDLDEYLNSSFEFEIKVGGRASNSCMLLDILSVASDRNKVPTQNETSVFSALCKKVIFPRCLVANLSFQKLL